MSSIRLSPFSFTILVLVGRDGAGAHDLRRMAAQGRVYWDAAPSQWYAEPKRLAEHGYLEAHKAPGRTHERTHYTLTELGREALAEWVRTPASLPRIQNEPVVRLLAADLVEPENVREGLESLRAEIDAALARVRVGQGALRPRAPPPRAPPDGQPPLRRADARAAARVARGGRGGAQRRKLALVAAAVRKR